MKIVIFIFVLLVLINTQVIEINQQNFYKLIQESQWLFVDFYDPYCEHCKKLSPEFKKISQQFDQKIVFGQLNILQNKQIAHKFQIFSYPTLKLFHQSQLGIFYTEQKTFKAMKDWLNNKLNYKLLPPQKEDQNPIIYKGPKNQNYKLFQIYALRDPYKIFRFIENNQSTQITAYSKKLSSLDNFEEILKKQSAGLFNLDEQPWVRIMLLKQKGIIFINTNENYKILDYLDQLAKKYYDIVFLHIEPDNSEYKKILSLYSLTDSPSFFAIDGKTGRMNLLQAPFKQKQINQFVLDFLDQKLPQYVKSQFSTDPNVLTGKNFHLLNQLKKDVLLFLYDNDKKKLSKDIINLAKMLTNHLKANPNIHIFRSNYKKNYLKFDFAITPKFPRIIFLRNRMRSHPIQFDKSEISYESIIDFIKENTTFDWVELDEL